MNWLEIIGFGVVIALPAMMLLCVVAWILEMIHKNTELLAGCIEYLIYRKQFHKWRKSDSELTPSDDRPAH